MSLQTFNLSISAVLLGVLVGGCATDRAQPTEELIQARTLIAEADKGNAQRYDPADLQHAHDELSSAERAASQHQYEDARRFAENAAVDADLASARGNNVEAQHAAQQVRAGIDTLQQESDHNTNATDSGRM